MGVLTGSISYTLYHVEGDVPERFREECMERIVEFQFQPLLPETEDDMTMGWVRVDDMLRWDFDNASVFRGEHVLLAMRTDRWALPSALLRATVAQRVEAFALEKGRVRLSKLERDVLRENVRREFKEHMLPSAGSVDMAWDLENGLLRFWSQSGRAKEQFEELFESTFEMRLHENGPYMAARSLPLTDDQLKALAFAEHTDFSPDE